MNQATLFLCLISVIPQYELICVALMTGNVVPQNSALIPALLYKLQQIHVGHMYGLSLPQYISLPVCLLIIVLF